jgi:cytochrome c oxidase subunit 2
MVRWMRVILPAFLRHSRSTSPAALIVGAVVLLVALGAVAGVALADQPHPWQFGMQEPATPVKDRIHTFHNELLVIILLITLFVLGLLAYVMVRFSARRHPVPTRTSHNPIIEVLWTVVPVVILVLIAIPSFKLMYYMDEVPDSKMTIKITGHQWYWTYQYADQGNLSFDSNMIQDKDLKPGQLRMLEVDNPLVVPVNTTIRVQIAGTDVIHSWYVPSFGVQEYAVVGRLNESWMRVEHEGVFRGECNQICGVNHAYMPIVVKAVSQADFDKWLGDAKKKFAVAPTAPAVAVADAAAPPISAGTSGSGAVIAAAGK